jgi:hypothetical protein
MQRTENHEKQDVRLSKETVNYRQKRVRMGENGECRRTVLR